MRKRFGTLDALVPNIGQGTWNLEKDDPREAVAALRRGVDLGLTHIDTAEMYGDGEVEKMVAKAIAHRRGGGVLAVGGHAAPPARRGEAGGAERSPHGPPAAAA